MAAPEPDTIVLHGDNLPLRVSAERVYFSFESGRLDYDCTECGAQCCRGHGYQIGVGSEQQRQLELRPAVRFFMRSADVPASQRLHVANCPPGCFFLADDNRCSIHTRHGHASKPETCRLFPFNKIRRVGEHLVVSPHPSLCPLRVLPQGTLSHRSVHSHLLTVLAEQGVATRIAVSIPPGPEEVLAIGLERACLALSSRHADATSYVPFAAEQLALTRQHLGRSPHRLSPVEHGECEAFLERLTGTLGIQAGELRTPCATVVRCVVATTPSVRAAFLFDDSTHLAGDRFNTLELLPKFLLALWVLVDLLRHAGSRVTYQSIMHVYRDNRTLLDLLMYLDRPVEWRRDQAVGMAPAGNRQDESCHVAVARHLIGRRYPVEVLGDVLQRYIPRDGYRRVAMLRGIAARVRGKIACADGPADPIPWYQRQVHTLNRRLLSCLPDEAFGRVVTRSSRRREK